MMILWASMKGLYLALHTTTATEPNYQTAKSCYNNAKPKWKLLGSHEKIGECKMNRDPNWQE